MSCKDGILNSGFDLLPSPQYKAVVNEIEKNRRKIIIGLLKEKTNKYVHELDPLVRLDEST